MAIVRCPVIGRKAVPPHRQPDSRSGFRYVQHNTPIIVSSQTGYCNSVAHLSESVLEEYALGRLYEVPGRTGREHVQACANCRERLEAEIGIVAAMRAAGERFQRMGGRSRSQAAPALSGRRKA